MSDTVVDDRDGACWITFNRPAVLNTLTVQDLHVVADAVAQASAAGRPVVFTGAGDRAFCAGMHLDVFAELVADPAGTRTSIGAVREMLDAVRTAEVVTVAAINGHCLGAAFELALACDFRISVPGALLGLPEMKLGLPCILDSALLSQYVGLGLAKEMMLTGRLYPAERLAAHEAVTVLDDGADLHAAAAELVGSFADISPVGIAAQKRLFEVWQNEPLATANDVSLDEIVAVFADDGTRRTVTAYAERLGAASR